MVEFEKAIWPRQIIGAAIWCALIAVIEYLSHMVLCEPVIFWSSMWIYVASGIWFGAWGVVAAGVGTTVSWMSALGFEVSALSSVGTILAALVPAWAFRHFKGDPRIKTSRDAFGFMVFGVFIPSFLSTLITSSIWYLYRIIPNIDALTKVVMPSFFLSNAIYTPIFGFILLLYFSNDVIDTRAYCKGWFS